MNYLVENFISPEVKSQIEKEILSLREKLNAIMAHHTGQPIERIEKDTDRDNFLSAQEAVDYGLVDKLLARRNS